LKHFATPQFWFHYRALPPDVQQLADEKFALLRRDPRHSSLRLKKVGIFWSARLGLHYRAVAKERPEGLVWIWIGRHDRYDEILKS
jgi:hypothetical protein